jgi:hypothetical protein
VHIGEPSPSPFFEPPSTAGERRERDLAAREVDVERREAALRRIQRAIALTPVPAEYFRAGQNSDEDGWWAQQLGTT